MKIKLFFLLFIITRTISVESQISPLTLAPTFNFDYVGAAQTYWKYRYRLVGDFMTPDSTAVMGEPGFMIIGEGPVGSGLTSVAQVRNKITNNYDCAYNPDPTCDGHCFNQGIYPQNYSQIVSGVMGWSDGEGNELGKYLGVLATEWELLSNNGLVSVSSNETEMELYYAMKSFNRIEQTAYQINGLTGQNGIFYRDDAPQGLAQTIFAANSQPPYNPSYPYKCSPCGRCCHRPLVLVDFPRLHSPLCARHLCSVL